MHSLCVDTDLNLFNSLGLPACAAYYVRIATPAQLAELACDGSRRFVLGGGSNLVLVDDFDGLVQRLRRLLTQPALLRNTSALRAAATRYDWRYQAPVYDQLVATMTTSRA